VLVVAGIVAILAYFNFKNPESAPPPAILPPNHLPASGEHNEIDAAPKAAPATAVDVSRIKVIRTAANAVPPLTEKLDHHVEVIRPVVKANPVTADTSAPAPLPESMPVEAQPKPPTALPLATEHAAPTAAVKSPEVVKEAASVSSIEQPEEETPPVPPAPENRVHNYSWPGK
jgi:hypothetical protein